MTARSLRARVLLEEARALGLDVEDLVAAARGCATGSVPTVAAFVAEVDATFSPATAATYRPYWRLAVIHHGNDRLSDLGVADLLAVVEAAARRARANRPGSTGRSARETCVAALRALYQRAVAAGVITTGPAAALTKPRRARSSRRALDDAELADLINAIRATSADPALDLLLVRFHLETGARRSGALSLRSVDINARRATVWLAEKDSLREQPISPSLVRDLLLHGDNRPAGAGAVFRRRDGRPVTGRDYDRIFGRARASLPWAERTPLSAHVLRHTAITTVGRIAGYPEAQAFAGHSPPTVTGRYLHATLAEVAAAVATMTGEPHPLQTLRPDHARPRCAR